MQTYGRNWRDPVVARPGRACASGHVQSRGYMSPLLRLNSTGEVSSADHLVPVDKTQFMGCSPLTSASCDNQGFNMKNWVTNRVTGFNGLTGVNNLKGQKTNFEDLSVSHSNSKGNTFDNFIANIGQEFVPNMQGRTMNTKPLQPQCGLNGWNYNQHNGVGIMKPMFGLFPCHQYYSSFNPFPSSGQFGHPNMFSPPQCSPLGGVWYKKTDFTNDHHCWQQRRRKTDRSYRGHSPKHHKCDKTQTEKRPEIAEKTACTHSASTKPHNMPLQEVSSQITENPVSTSAFSSDGASKSKSSQVCQSPDIAVPCHDIHSESAVDASCDNFEIKKHIPDAVKEPGTMKRKLTVKVKASKMTDQSDSASSSSGQGDSDKQTTNNINVLFIRKNWRKGRPSSSKQRRRKLQKARTSTAGCETPSGPDNSVQNEKDADKAKSFGCSAVSFILGLNSSPSPTVPNSSSSKSDFVFSFSDDEDDDEDDDGSWEDDFNFADIQADFSQCDLLNFLPNSNNTPKTPVNFQFHISPVKSSENEDKTIADINSTWNVQISLKEDCQRQHKKAKKKVHFPEDCNLAVVHPMVAWSYAYRSARKGHWENFGRDRERFRRRIQEVEEIIVPILDSKHRSSVYNKYHDCENVKD